MLVFDSQHRLCVARLPSGVQRSTPDQRRTTSDERSLTIDRRKSEVVARELLGRRVSAIGCRTTTQEQGPLTRRAIPEGSYKPSSVYWAIHLGRRSPDASCGLPGDDNAAGHHSLLTWPCSGWGLPCPGGYPHGRWALTPPFHPYLQPRTATGGLFSVALSVGFRRPGVTRHPALWSSDFPRTARPKAPARGPSLPSRHPEYHGAARARSRLNPQVG